MTFNKNNYEKRGFLNDTFKLFHMKDSMQETIDYHYHEFNKIYLLISGHVTYNIEGQQYPLLPYDIVLVHRNELHKPEIDASFPYERIILYTNLSETSLLSYCFTSSKNNKQPVIRIKDLPNTRLFETVKELEHATATNDFASNMYEATLFNEFMILLNRHIIHKQYSFVSAHSSNNKIHQILTYINEHLNEDLSIETLSSQFYISKYHLMRTFKVETSYSLHSYITDKRLLLARDLLSKNISIGDVCYQCGFHEYSTFFRAFKKKYHCTPSQIHP